LLDDFQARQEATEKGIPVRGTLALLLMAKERNLVQEVGPLIDQLDALGFRVSDAVRETILEIARET
jgi:predicted nucleic acid-binding protein